MKSVTVHASKTYDVFVGDGLLRHAGSMLKSVINAGKPVIISDSNVWPLYGPVLEEALCSAGYRDSIHYVFPAGEQSKSPATYISILEFLAENRVTRGDCLIALGGGVVGDITGFAAATYLRGIDFVQIPTTLLAAVDSSVGGKTAIDLSAGKNLAGAFCQPRLVLCDISTLDSLPVEIFLDGCAEVIKYGVLYDQTLFDLLGQYGPAFPRETVIARCIELKRDVVAADEFDRGERQKLNLGHTVGHGIEARSNFSVSHGKAVAMGMAIISRASAQMGLCSSDTAGDICRLLERFGLPTTTDLPSQAIYESALSDKKRSGNSINLVVPEAIGSCRILPVQTDALKQWIDKGI